MTPRSPDQPVPSSPRNPSPIHGSVYLNAPDGAYALFANRVLIGRARHCRVVLRDPLVSREHACLHIEPDHVTIENLQADNQTYVNGSLVRAPIPLYPRDRILVGTTQLSVYRIDEQPHDPTTGPTSRSPEPVETTDHDQALSVLGRVADRMFGQGCPTEAEIVLSEHLENVLDGARSGLEVPGQLCDLAAHYALMLALNLRKGLWVEYAVELHLCSRHPLARSTAQLLEAALRVTHDLNETWLIGSLATMGPHARQVIRAQRTPSIG